MWNFQDFLNNVAVIDDSKNQITYGDLVGFCNSFAKNFSQRSLVVCLCSNSVGALVGYTSSILNHHPVLLLDAQIDEELLQYFIEVYQPDYLWIPQERNQNYGEVVFKNHNYQLVKTPCSSKSAFYDDLALLLTTSGSTGSPKLVRLSYKNLIANTDSIISYLGITSSERPITTLPMNYTYGLSIINSHLKVGATLLFTEKSLMQKDFWEFMIQEKATSFGGVPYTYEMLNKLFFFRRELPDLKTMTQAGGKLLPDLHKKIAESARNHNKNFIVMYGQTEATARMAYLPADKSLEKCGSMGIAIPGGRFELINDNGELIDIADTVGELIYYGDNVMLGYAQSREDLCKGDECFGRLETGDMAKFDKDGFYYIVGRKKRFLKIFGNRLGLDETECLIKSHFSNIECACLGKDDKLYVFITDKTLCHEVKKFLVDKTKLNPVAFTVIYLSEIPKNDVGKIRYSNLESFYE